LGVKGAAIATSGSNFFQVFVLFAIFLKKNNRESYGTSRYTFKLASFLQCIKIGLPGAVFVVIEILGWATFYWMMTLTGERYITVAGICQSVAILFYFFAEGVSKAATTIAGNLIGAQRTWHIPSILRSGFILHLLFFTSAIAIVFVTSNFLIEQFLPTANEEMIASMHDTLLISLYAIVTYLFFEGIRMLISGILTAAGDTFFLLIAGSLSVWVLLVLPIYWVIVLGRAEVEIGMLICVFYSIGASLLYYWRFSEGKWKFKSIRA
jgi:MATE family multidrug resistance protein